MPRHHALSHPRAAAELLPHRNHQAVYTIVAFRYARLVTVPGKGGRPRKWRSDADRVRAYRARQAGR